MNNKQVNTQDIFLNQVRKEYIPVTIYLSNSFQLKGTVKCFDNFVIILESNDKKQTLIYKHPIASIVPLKYVNIEG